MLRHELAQAIWNDLEQIRFKKPLIHNITNLVVMNWTANVLLALGASPVMAHAAEEVEEIAGIACGLVINIGTLNPSWIHSMELALNVAKAKGLPAVLDPVGAGATRYRSETVWRLLESGGVTIVRGNASEIAAIKHNTQTRGVDSTMDATMAALPAAMQISTEERCTVVVSGDPDLIVHHQLRYRVFNGHPIMTRVTGMGCASTAVIGAFAAVNPDPNAAALHAMAFFGLAGERAQAASHGPGSFQAAFLDQIATLKREHLEQALRVETAGVAHV